MFNRRTARTILSPGASPGASPGSSRRTSPSALSGLSRFAAALLLLAPVAGAQDITPISSTDVGTVPLQPAAVGFSLAETHDGLIQDAGDGYISDPFYFGITNPGGPVFMGATVNYVLDQDYKLTSFSIWNDADISATGDGIRKFDLVFRDSGGSVISTLTDLGVFNDPNRQDFSFPSAICNVRSFDLVIKEIYTRSPLQWREVAMVGTPATRAVVGVAKSAVVSGSDVTYSFTLQNSDCATATTISLLEDLDAVFGSGNYTVSAPTLFSPPLLGSSVITVNAGFTGSGANTDLLTGSNVLESGDSAVVDLVVTITNVTDPDGGGPLGVGEYSNQVTSVSDDASGGGPYTDASVNGANPDPDGSGDPGDDPGIDDGSTMATVGVNAVIGVAKNATVSTNTITYDYFLENLGNAQANSISMLEDLDAVFGAGNYLLISGPTIVTGPASIGSSLLVEPTFTGSGGTTEMIQFAVFNTGDTAQIQIVVAVTTIVDQGDGVGVYRNAVQTVVTGPSGSGPFTDDSVSGTDPDPTTDGDPTNDTSDTLNDGMGANAAVLVAPLVKSAGSRVQFSGTTYDVSYALSLTNSNPLTLTNVQITDDLQAAFAPLPDADWSIVAGPTLGGSFSGSGTANSGFTGEAGAQDLLSGDVQLAQGATGTVTFTVRIDLVTNGPVAGGNQAVATSLEVPGPMLSDDPGSGGASDPTPIPPAPNMVVTKVAGTPTLGAGLTFDLVYTITVDNPGTVLLTTIQVTDDLEAALAPLTPGVDWTLVGTPVISGFTGTGSADATFDGQTAGNTSLLTGDVQLVPGGSGTIDIAVNVDPITNGPLVGTNQGVGTSPDFPGSANSNTVAFPSVDRLGMTKVAATPVRVSGDTYDIAYTIALENTGLSTLTGIAVTDDLQAAFAPLPTTDWSLIAGPTLTGFTGTGTANSGFNGQSAGDPALLSGDVQLASTVTGTIAFTVRIDLGTNGPVTGVNQASASTVELPGPLLSDDPNQGGTADATPIPGVLQIDKVASTPVIVFAQTFDVPYTITAENLGQVTLTNLALTDDLELALAPLAAGDWSIQVAPTLSGGFTGSGSADPSFDGLTAGVTALLMGDVQLPQGSGNIDFTLRVDLTNGPVSASNQASGSSTAFVGPVLSDDPGISGDANATPFPGADLLTVTKISTDLNGGDVEAGDVLTYTITVLNVSTENASAAVMNDAMPGNTTYIASSTTLNGAPVVDMAGNSALIAGTLIESPGQGPGVIAAGASAVVTFSVTVDASTADGTQIANQAKVLAVGAISGFQESDLSDDPGTPALDDPTIDIVGGGAQVFAVKTVVDLDGGALLAGDTLVYTITLENTGSASATGLVVTDPVPSNSSYAAGTILLDADGSGPGAAVTLTDGADPDAGDFDQTTSGAVTVAVGDIAAGAQATVEFRVTVAGGAVSGDTVSNQASIVGDSLALLLTDADSDAQNGAQVTRIVVGAAPGLALSKSIFDVNGGAILPGDILEYRLELENFGSSDATNVVLADPLPPTGTTYVAGSTVREGAVQADAGGPASVLVAGVNLGTLTSGQTSSWRVRVIVDGSANTGDMIFNQATFVADGGLSGLSDSDLNDGLETGNDAGDPDDDDPTVVTVGGTPGSATISGEVWVDADHDRIFGVGESAVVGFTVEVLRNSSVVASATTDGAGAWTISGLMPGPGYQVRFRDPVSGAVFGDPVSGVPGTTTTDGIIDGLTLGSGNFFIDLSLPLDPSGVIYDSQTRAPLSGSVLILSGPPGFVPATHLLPGQQGQTTGVDGRYRFDLIAGFPAGVYTLGIAPPSGYSTVIPSVLIPPQAGPLDPTGFPDPFEVVPNENAPVGGDPTIYFVDFDLAAGDPNVVNNHVPLDPVGATSFNVIKAAAKNKAYVGEIIPFEIRLQNNLSNPFPAVDLRDLMPPGFKYIEGSGRLDGVAVEPTLIGGGRQLLWSGLAFAASEERVINLLAVVGTGVNRGQYTNRAQIEGAGAVVISNIAEAQVLVTADPLFDSSDIIGQVFEDHDGDGYQSDGEPGVPGVVLITTRGLRITTDEHGRYHIALADEPLQGIGSNFILKIDPNSLPLGYVVTSENPRVVRLTPGKLAKINFGVRPPGWVVRDASGEDGQPEQRQTVDGELDPLDVSIRYQRDDAEHVLNVTAVPMPVENGKLVNFVVYTNYGRWIERAEIWIYDENDSVRAEPLAVVPIDMTRREASWRPEFQGDRSVKYVLRVYDPQGRSDRTGEKLLDVSAAAVAKLHTSEGFARESLVGYGENHLAASNIPVDGAAVLVNGRDIPEGSTVTFLGASVPVSKGKFAAQEWLPFGEHEVDVQVRGANGAGIKVSRKIYIPEEEWVFVALADILVGTSSVGGLSNLDDVFGGGNGLIQDASGSIYEDETYVNGRAAMYLKGRIKGDWLLTAALDTRDQKLEDIFDTLDDKDPTSVLRRIDPDEVYAVYGDDSTTIEDAPTQGKLYVRLEKGDSYALWGNFRTSIVGSDLAQVDRALYGGKFHWESPSKTSRGDDRVKLDVFGASPDSAVGRDELRGTGGSIYYLRQQDLTVGSERLRIEVRDKDSGIVIQSKYLVPFDDYQIDYFQGRVLLNQPLPTLADDGLLISDSSLSGHPVVLVARYDFTPSFTDTDNMAFGGRGEAWITDNVRIGVTGSDEEQGVLEQKLMAADITYRHSPGTYIKAEGARTEGSGFGEDASIDGGFSFNGIAQDTDPDVEADAWRVEGSVDFADVVGGTDGQLDFYAQKREQGFSAPGQLTATDTDQWGASVDTALLPGTRVGVDYDELEQDGGLQNKAVNVDLSQELGGGFSATVGARRTERENDGPSGFIREGDRTDVGVRVDYDSGEDWSTYVFGQVTADTTEQREDNDRGGVGGALRLNDRMTVGAEISGGEGGLGGKLEGSYDYSDRTNFYLSYLSNADRSDTGLRSHNGAFVSGMRSRFTDELSIFAEERLTHGTGVSGLSHSFGLDFAPTDRWTFGFTAETGELEDPFGGQLDRDSVTVSGSYGDDYVRYGTAVEWRDEELTAIEREVWAWRNDLNLKVSDDWRALAEFDILRSDDDSGTFFDGEFTDAVIGFAYRPTRNDRFNALLTYRYLENSPTAGQLNALGSTQLFQQRSHVVAIDATVRISKWLDLGGKYALRSSELRTLDDSWFDSDTSLAIARADFHVVKEWDVLAEGRWHEADLADDARVGFLGAVYRHIGDHVKLGVGYNFTDFSDDLTDLDYDASGFFVNLVGKF